MTEELLVAMFRSGVRVRFLRWMAHHEGERVPVSKLRKSDTGGSGQYLPLMHALHDAGLVTQNDSYRWVVVPHPAWEYIRRFFDAT
jgi:hypothetical protein